MPPSVVSPKEDRAYPRGFTENVLPWDGNHFYVMFTWIWDADENENEWQLHDYRVGAPLRGWVKSTFFFKM